MYTRFSQTNDSDSINIFDIVDLLSCAMLPSMDYTSLPYWEEAFWEAAKLRTL